MLTVEGPCGLLTRLFRREKRRRTDQPAEITQLVDGDRIPVGRNETCWTWLTTAIRPSLREKLSAREPRHAGGSFRILPTSNGGRTVKKGLSTPSRIARRRTHGFRVRMATAGGRKVINARRARGRKRLAPSTPTK